MTNLKIEKGLENIAIGKLKIKPLEEKLRTNMLVISNHGESYSKEVPFRVFFLGGRDSKITQISSFYEDEITFRHIQDHVILMQAIIFENKITSIEYSPRINDTYFRTSNVKKLETTQKIWRYIDISKLEDLIKTKALFFNRLDRFSDSLEGVSPDSCEECILNDETSKSLEERHENVRLMKKRFEFARNSTFTSCWHINDVQNERMWKEYANGKSSIAIETTYGNLLSAKEEMLLPIHIEQIRYFDEPYVNQESYWFPFLFKRKGPFEWENELRLSIYAYNYDNQTHLRVKVPLNKVIKKIHLSPLAKFHELTNLKQLFKMYKINLPIFHNNKKIIY